MNIGIIVSHHLLRWFIHSAGFSRCRDADVIFSAWFLYNWTNRSETDICQMIRVSDRLLIDLLLSFHRIEFVKDLLLVEMLGKYVTIETVILWSYLLRIKSLIRVLRNVRSDSFFRDLTRDKRMSRWLRPSMIVNW